MTYPARRSARPAGRRRAFRGEPEQPARQIPADVMAPAIERAMRELQGSVAAEALPEMAVRLARHRMFRTESKRLASR